MSDATRPGGLLRLATGSPEERLSLLRKDWRAARDRAGPAAKGDVWWIAATPAAASAVRTTLVDGEAPGVLDPGVMTLRHAAERLTADSTGLRLGPAARRALIDEIADRARRRDALGPLESLVDTPGMTGYLASRFRQLRREGVGPQQAGAALRRADGELVGPALARLYRDYLAALECDRLRDDEGVVIDAAACAAGPDFALRHLLIDLPLNVAPIERTLLRAIASGAEALTVAVSGPPSAEARGASADGWRQLLGAAEVKWLDPDELSDPVAVSLKAIREGLFAEVAPPASDVDGVAVVTGENEQDTARRVARRIKLLLTERGAATRDVVLAAPRLETNAPRYTEALAECGVPVSVDLADRLGSASLVTAAVDWLSTADTDWRFDDLLRLVGRTNLAAFSQASPSARFATLRAATEWFVRAVKAPSGSRYLQRHADELAAREGSGGSDSMRRLADAATVAREAFSDLAASRAELPDRATPLGWVDAVATALARLGRSGFGGSGELSDRRAADTIEEAAAAVESLARWRGRDAPMFDLRGFLELLRGWAASLRLPKDTSHGAGVRIVGVEAAIGLPCRHLVVVGVDEASFAPSGSDADQAMRLFYELAARPSESLTLAYAALDEKAQPLSPSPLVADVERLFKPGATRAGAAPLHAGVDPDTPPASPREWRLQASVRAAAGDGATLAAYGGALVHGLTAVDVRGRGESFGPWEGVLEGATALLSERFGSEHLWSASQLELMATCPFKFFATHLLRLEPAEGLALDTDPRRRGSLMHDALAACHAAIATEASTGGVDGDDLSRRLTDAIGRLNDSGRLPLHEAALAEIEGRQASRWAGVYAEQQHAFETDARWRLTSLRPQLLEARFGPATGDGSHDDPASTDQPFELQLPGGEVLRLAGRIDRVDAAAVGDQTVFAVVDYKTAKRVVAKAEDFEAGRQLQPILYALAAQQLFFDGPSTPVAAGYWGVREQGFVAPRKLRLATIEEGVVEPTDEWLAAVDAARRHTQELVADVRAGHFPMTNPDEECGKRCDFATICRVGQARSLGKTPPAPNPED